MTHLPITLHADLPEVTETPTGIEVRCGETAVSVHHEHGHLGSGDWAVWAGSGTVCGGSIGYPVERALRDAREHVRRQERSRVLHAQLRAELGDGR